MDAKTNIEARLPSRHVTEGPARAPHSAFEVADVFKRTRYVADSSLAGRDVAKDMFEAGGIPLLTKALLDNVLHGACMTVAGCTIVENMKSVNWKSGPDATHPGGKAEEISYADA